MNSILDTIALKKAEEVREARLARPLSALANQQELPVRDFAGALQNKNPAIIAEIKKASPSKGIIRADFNVAAIARSYEQNGAACLSVLTDAPFFQGASEYLALAKQQVSIPVLRKDFIIDSYQIYESRALGADCILLIAALLDDQQLMDFCQLALELGMAVLVESHTREELDRALRLPTPLMGINNRSLHSFITDLNTSIELTRDIPADKLIISESGINTPQDIRHMQDHGIKTFLVGESLMRQDDPGIALRDLIAGPTVRN